MTSALTDRRGLTGTFAYCLTATALNMTSAILAYIMVTYAEVSASAVTSLLTIPSVVGTVFGFLSGELVRRFGIRRFTLFVQTTELISGAIYLFFGNKTAIWVLWIAAALYGFMLGTQQMILSELLRVTVPDERKRSSFLGYGNSVMSIGGVFFATVGGMIAARDGGAHWERAFWLYLLVLACLLVEFLTLPRGKDAAKAVSGQAAGGRSRLPSGVWAISVHYCLFFLFLYAYSLNISDYIINVHSLGTSVEAGLAISFMTVGGIVSGLAFGTYSRLLGRWTMPVLLLLTVVGLALVVLAPGIIGIYIAAILLGVSMMGAGPYALMRLGQLVPGDDYPRAAAVMSGFTNLGMMVAVYVLSFLSSGLVSGGRTQADSQLTVALIGAAAVCVLSLPIYAFKGKASKE